MSTLNKENMKKLTIGWREWCSFPELSLPAVKFKTDTGATLSALHALNITTFFKEGTEYVQFTTQPLKEKDSPLVVCTAPVKRRKIVTSSNGMKEKRIVIKTTLRLGERSWPIEITLTDRSKLTYRMLLGREAMSNMVIHPKKSFCLGIIHLPRKRQKS